ncbi:hypothetical protein QCA50_001068 [Cerrena zonata]|uniref:Carbohydrate kinase PfkB domain-containing protein n=1 Tax=Cerrena zonata TaxID=2478898 RepID=A0AAW0GSA9_9APHY
MLRMSRSRKDTQETLPLPLQRPLRVVASGTLFLTHTLALPSHPEPSSAIRAHSVTRARGGSASTCLSILAQFPNVDAMLVAPLGGNDEGQMVIRDLESERVSTRFCKIWENAGVPSAWVLHADDTDTKTVINNNPLPDITHEEFVSSLGPILAPENYAYLNQQSSSSPGSPPQPNQQLGSVSSRGTTQPYTPPARVTTNPNSPAPFEWIHFEGRTVKTTLSNIAGLDGLARERKWRSHCVFSLDVGRRARQGVEALIPHADVIFLNKHYAIAHSPDYGDSPKAFLLSLTHMAPPHALLVAHWGSEGAAVLSVPTKEYFQSSGWVEQIAPMPSSPTSVVSVRDEPIDQRGEEEMVSVRSGSGFWAGAGHHTESSGDWTASSGIQRQLSGSSNPSTYTPPGPSRRQLEKRRQHRRKRSDSSTDSDDTQIAVDRGRGSNGGSKQNHANQRPPAIPVPNPVVDDIGASDAFIAGMMYALSRRMLPGEPYTPSAVRKDRDGSISGVAGAGKTNGQSAADDRGRWKLEECLRFATELAGRKARRRGWEGLAEEMARAGWFDG